MLTTAPSTNAESEARAASLVHFARRLDWRFLLSSPELGAVCCVGKLDDELRQALAQFAARLATISDDQPCDLVVAADPDAAALTAAIERLQPGGSVYFEFTRGRRSCGAAEARRLLASQGLVDARLHWHWPNFANCSEIVPLHSQSAVDLFFSRRRGGLLGRCKATLGRLLARRLPTSRWARCVSMVATKPKQTTSQSIPFSCQYGLGTRPSYVLITPRFQASSHVVWLLMKDGEKQPAVVAKTPRLSGCSDSLSREAGNLRALQDGCGTPLSSAPRLLEYSEHADRPTLVETAVAGRPLDPRDIRRRMTTSCRSVLCWLDEIQPAARQKPAPSTDSYERLVEPSIGVLEQALSDNSDDMARLSEVRRVVGVLRGQPLPAILEHGDLSPPNLLVLADGSVGAVDWELSEPRGLPLSDWLFFLAYASFALCGAARSGRYVAAYHKSLFVPGAWARPWVLRYAKSYELPHEALSPLLVAAWTRYLAGIVTRLDASGRSANIASGLRTNRYYGLWRHSLANLARLDWQDCDAASAAENP